jgi:hypothetical protein
MPTPESIEVVMSTIAVLVELPDQTRRIDERELKKHLRAPITMGQLADGEGFVTSQRDQIEALVGGNRINVRDLSGRIEFSESKVPSVLHYFVESSNSTVTAYGINFQVAVSHTSSSRWIIESILASDLSERLGREVIGGTASVKMSVPPKVLRLAISPMDDDRVNVDLNVHQETATLPDDGALREELQLQFNGLMQILNALEL